MVSIEKVIGMGQDALSKLTGEEKRRLLFICTAGFILVLTLSVVFSLSKDGGGELSAESERAGIMAVIPPEELFLPDEPDFLPGVLLEREQRLIWTEQDAMEYWQDPLRYGEEQWREKIETAVDEILERVP